MAHRLGAVHPVLGPVSPPGGSAAVACPFVAMTPQHRFRWLQRGLLVLGLLLLALWSGTYFESRGFQAAESMKLEAALREAQSGRSEATPGSAALVGPSAPDPPKRATGQEGVLGRIEIPRLRIAAIVAEGTDAKTLRRAVGHITSTALPGSPGNCALAGHRDTFLRGLGGVRVDDVIRIVTLERTYTYQVEWGVVVEPQRVDLLDSTATHSLTLVTCYPFTYVGHAPQRFVVRARQVEAVTGHRDVSGRPGPPAATSAKQRRHDKRVKNAASTRGPTAIEDRGALQPQGLTAEGR